LRLATLPRSVRHKAYCVDASPRLVVRRDRLIGSTTKGRSLSDQWRLPRFRRLRHGCTQRLRFRGFIPLPVEVAVRRFLSCHDNPGSPGLASLGRSPSLPSGLTTAALPCRRTQTDARTAPEPCGTRPRLTPSPLLSGTSGTLPNWVLLPVLQSFKELGSWLTSPEVAGPLRFPSLSRALELGCRTAGNLCLLPGSSNSPPACASGPLYRLAHSRSFHFRVWYASHQVFGLPTNSELHPVPVYIIAYQLSRPSLPGSTSWFTIRVKTFRSFRLAR
jgi:hypothetical protein